MTTAAPVRSQDGREVVLRAVGINKAYGATQALADADLELRRGEIHALMGGNGSGKSTLIKILSGVERGDSGQVEFADFGTAASKMTPGRAREAGLHVVHQRSSVFPDMTVAENMALGGEFPSRGGLIRWRQLRDRTKRVLERFEIDARPDSRVDKLSPAVQTTVAIARALQDSDEDPRGILILDEPTAALPSHEVEILLSALRRYARQGHGIMLVTHRLDEVLSVADRVTVIRDGRVVGSTKTEGLTHDELVDLMLGRSPEKVFQTPGEHAVGATMLEVRGLAGGPLRGVDLSLRQGEVVGIAGLLGSGRTELLQSLFGIGEADGEILIEGKAVKFKSCQQAMDAGLAYVPEDRAAAAAFLELSVGVNMTIATLDSYWQRLRIQSRQERRDVAATMREANVKAPGPNAPLSVLSGGNQQKVILARWLRRRPRILLLDEPTQGVDVGARSDIHAQIHTVVRQGASALLVSSDFEELADACDRVLVLAAGRIIADVSGSELNNERLTSLVYQTA